MRCRVVFFQSLVHFSSFFFFFLPLRICYATYVLFLESAESHSDTVSFNFPWRAIIPAPFNHYWSAGVTSEDGWRSTFWSFLKSLEAPLSFEPDVARTATRRISSNLCDGSRLVFECVQLNLIWPNCIQSPSITKDIILPGNKKINALKKCVINVPAYCPHCHQISPFLLSSPFDEGMEAPLLASLHHEITKNIKGHTEQHPEVVRGMWDSVFLKVIFFFPHIFRPFHLIHVSFHPRCSLYNCFLFFLFFNHKRF